MPIGRAIYSNGLVERARGYLGQTARQIGVRSTLWCSAFIRHITGASGVDDRARSWLAKPHVPPQVGAIAVLTRGKRGGHVGMVWLRPSSPESVETLKAQSDTPELRLQVRGYVEPPELDDPDHAEAASSEEAISGRIALDNIADHLFSTLRGSNNLVFGGSRRTVESTADRLRRRSEKAKLPNEFFPHHGSLAKNLREDLEDRLKTGGLPTTAICTSTLELGVDIGSVKSVAQIGSPRSLSSLRQRLGRTGRRRGVPSVLRVYVREPHIGKDAGILDRLRPNTIRSVAVIRLLLGRFVEPAGQSSEVASTLIHQILSLITKRGGMRARPMYDLLCGPGPFKAISPSEFADLLRHLACKEIQFIEQAEDGLIMLGAKGEQVVQSRSFFAVFETAEEWRLISSGRSLGTLPISYPVHKDGLVVFAGQRWIILDIDEKTNTLIVAPHPGGVVPRFERADGERLHDRLAQEMLAVYRSVEEPAYLDEKGRQLLREGRETFKTLQLATKMLVQEERDLHVFLWRGSQATAVFGAAAAMVGLPGEVHDLGLTLSKTNADDALAKIKSLSVSGGGIARISAFVENISSGKFSEQVPTSLGRSIWTRQNKVYIDAVPQIARSLSQ